MKRKLMELQVRGRIFLQEKMEKFLSEEKGASHMIEIIVVAVVVIGVATVFKTELGKAIVEIFKKVTTFINQG